MTTKEKEAKLKEIKSLLATPAPELIQKFRAKQITGKLLQWLCGKQLYDKGYLYDPYNFKWAKKADLEAAGTPFVPTPTTNEPWLIATFGVPATIRADGKSVPAPAFAGWHKNYVMAMQEDRRVASQFAHVAESIQTTDDKDEDDMIKQGKEIGLF